ncbi:hypothetical protein JR316_0004032 [Psilocybe cubensis]|uniref:F-box domain-containing protein n=2 Tax=Psilocybe cubensis TaxID=181762 RepID=A0A8H8CNI8_PSICU|nr:hypothetical protein JR316_0004032 [Psilocybe cubensis]KAH9484550.1 hypothetical protein JR316_0004032 [Psilocybe cubensis]
MRRAEPENAADNATECLTQTTTLPPISRLNHDVLRYIFSLNGHADSCFTDVVSGRDLDDVEHPPLSEASLTVTRYSSQVCQEWRELLLNSPTIWATAFDLQCLDQVTDDWRDEVLRRTADSLLTIIGNLSRGRPSTYFFSELLEIHWSRIRRLHVSDHRSGLDDVVWNALQQPSPNLEILRIDMRFVVSDFAQVSLFANCAPQLQSLQAPSLSMKPDMPWLSNIRHLWNFDMDICTVQSGFLRVLDKMPHLESISLNAGQCFYQSIANRDSDANAVADDPLIHVSCPRLMRLELNGDIFLFSPILQYVTPSENCVLLLNGEAGFTKTFGLPEATEFGDALSTFFRNSPRRRILHPPKNLPLLYYTLTKTELCIIFTHSCFSNDTIFVVKSDANSSWQDLPGQILRALPICTLEGTKDLYITLDHLPVQNDTAQLLKLFRRLGYLEIISLSWRTLSIVNRVLSSEQPPTSKPNIIFPHVNTISLYMNGFRSDPLGNVLREFLVRRIEIGIPIKDIYLRNWGDHDEAFPLLFDIVDNFNCKLHFMKNSRDTGEMANQ